LGIFVARADVAVNNSFDIHAALALPAFSLLRFCCDAHALALKNCGALAEEKAYHCIVRTYRCCWLSPANLLIGSAVCAL